MEAMTCAKCVAMTSRDAPNSCALRPTHQPRTPPPLQHTARSCRFGEQIVANVGDERARPAEDQRLDEMDA